MTRGDPHGEKEAAEIMEENPLVTAIGGPVCEAQRETGREGK